MKPFLCRLLFWLGVGATAAYLGLYYEVAKSVAVVVFAILFVISLFKSRWRALPRLYKSWLWLILGCVFVCMLCYGNNVELAVNTALPLMVCFSSSYLFEDDENGIMKWFIPFSIFISYCAIMSIVKGVGSFEMAEYYVENVAKNQICPFFAIISIVSYSMALKPRITWFLRFYLLSVSLTCIYPSLFLLNRTSLIAFGLSCLLLTYLKGRIKGLVAIALIVGFVLLLKPSVATSVYNSIIGNRDISDIDSLTSYRMAINRDAWAFFLDHPLLGEIGLVSGWFHSKPHLYLLYNSVHFGLIGGIPFFALYGSIIWLFVKALRQGDLLCVGVLLIALLESLAEYSSPFGPGTTYVFCYIIVGSFIRNYYHINDKDNDKKTNDA